MLNDAFSFIVGVVADVASLARMTVFTAFGVPISLFEVWASLFVLSALLSLVFVSHSVSFGDSENAADSTFSSLSDTIFNGNRTTYGRKGSSWGGSPSERTSKYYGFNHSDSTTHTFGKSKNKRKGRNTTINFRF